MSFALFIPNASLSRKQIAEQLKLQTESVAVRLDQDIQTKVAKLESLASIGQLNGLDAQKHIDLLRTFSSQNPDMVGAAVSLTLTGESVKLHDGKPVDLSDRTYNPRFVKPILYITDTVRELAKGDLRPRLNVKTKDELGILAGSMNAMLESLSATIGQVSAASGSVANAALQITASTEEVAQGSVDQADRARTMSRLFAGLESSMDQVASNANHAKGLSQEAVDIAGEGNSFINTSIDKMEQAKRRWRCWSGIRRRSATLSK